ncbi:MAG: outer membrane beta-barrel protein [Cytophagales bacterium]
MNSNRLINIIRGALASLIFFLALAMIAFDSHAQKGEEKDCGEVLNQARRYYQLGQIEKVPGVLESCMNGGFSKEQKSEAYELIVLTYQYDNQPVQAEETYIELLRHDPEYTINELNTPNELLRLYKTYHAPPVYSIGFLGGVNMAFGQRTQSYGPSNSERELSDYSNDGLGFQVGLTVKRYISKKFELNLDLMYNNVRYQRTLNQLAFANIVFKEDQKMFKFPMTLTYGFEMGKFSPYIRLGGGISYMFSSEAIVERLYSETSQLPDVTGPPIDVSGQRNDINFFSTAGIGLRFKIPRGVIVLDARHNWYFLQQNRPSKRYENNVLVYEYHYIDDDFKLGNYAFSLGYTYSFHKIKLIKKRNEVTKKVE